jgi:hypothetical protein
VWACRVRQGGAVSAPVILNAPAPWWWNGDGGEFASPGGWLRVFGKSPSFGGESRALLRTSDGRSISLAARAGSGYALSVPLSADIPAGDYTLSIHNGLGGDASWRSAGTVAAEAGVDLRQPYIGPYNLGDFRAMMPRHRPVGSSSSEP